MRLNKYISDSGYCSRREADRLIEAGKVLVNGTEAFMGMQVEDEDIVSISGKDIKAPTAVKKVIYAFYKPEGIVSTMADEPDSLAAYLKNKGIDKRVFPVGRLDKESCGLLLLTNDGELMNNILKTSNNHQKEYVVKVNKDGNMIMPDAKPGDVRFVDGFEDSLFSLRHLREFLVSLCDGFNVYLVHITFKRG